MAIYITGDTHGNFGRFSTKKFPDGKDLAREDYVIICGDFGGVWAEDEWDPKERYWLDWLEEKPWTTLFIDGNHENFDRLNALPIEDFCGGKVHKIRSNIFHLIRGEVFNIDRCTFLAFGGAPSHDIQDGIIDPSTDPNWKERAKKMRIWNKMFRIKGISWWEQETPTKADFDNARKNLARYNNKVDFILTHEAPASAFFEIAALNHVPYKFFQPSETAIQIQDLIKDITYKRHFFGHHHMNELFYSGECLYGIIKQIH